MESIEILRNVVTDLAQNRMGKPKKQPHQFTVQTSASEFLELIATLPIDAGTWEPLQDPITGELYHVTGTSPLGSEPIG